MATKAAPSWASIKDFDTPGRDLMWSYAPFPLIYVGIAMREIPSRTTRLARFRSSLFVMRESRNKPPPMIVPTVGKWFSKRWICVKSIVILKPDAPNAATPLDYYNTWAF
jgi:hypothetical protein